jgi:hypothetical protein
MGLRGIWSFQLAADETCDIELQRLRLRIDTQHDLLLVVLLQRVDEHADVGALRRQRSVALSCEKDAGSPGRLEILDAALGNERNTAVVRRGTVAAPAEEEARVVSEHCISWDLSANFTARLQHPVGTPPEGMKVTKTHN